MKNPIILQMMRSRQIQKILEYPEDPGVPEKHNRTSYSFKILNEKAYNPTELGYFQRRFFLFYYSFLEYLMKSY